LSDPEDNRLGKYRLLARLAVGGMAEIHLASHTGPGGFEKLVVVKLLLPEMARDERFVAMFLDEARIAVRFSHQNVVQTIDAGSDRGRYFIVMEFLPGESLATTLEECRQRDIRLPPELASGIIAQAAGGLHHIHTSLNAAGRPLSVIHRDVSPDNIFVLEGGVAKIVDFGIAKAPIRTTETRTGIVKGKLGYMSPEQVRGASLDARSDVFSLGIVLWECLAGARLFARESDLMTLRAIAEEDAPSPAARNPDAPEALCRIALQALARNQAHRFASAEELRAALVDYIRSSHAEADTIAIGRFMQGLFESRFRTKSEMIEGTLSGDRVHDASRILQVGSTTPDRLKTRKRRWPYAVLVLLLLAGGLAGFLTVTDRSSSTPGSDTATRSDTAVRTEPVDIPVTPAPQLGDDRQRPEDGYGDGDSVKPVVPAKIHVKSKKPRTTRHRTQKTGKLRLMTTPWVSIYHRGRKIGQTPLVDVEFPAGVVELRAVNPEAGIDRRIRVRIKAGETVIKRHSFP
jgi:serine/threonine protein kinase